VFVLLGLCILYFAIGICEYCCTEMRLILRRCAGNQEIQRFFGNSKRLYSENIRYVRHYFEPTALIYCMTICTIFLNRKIIYFAPHLQILMEEIHLGCEIQKDLAGQDNNSRSAARQFWLVHFQNLIPVGNLFWNVKY
jgi:hypothetical protein